MSSKRMGLFKDVLVALLMTSLYPLAFMLTDAIETPRLNVLYIHPVWLFLSSLGYEMLKDIRDMKGDRQVHGADSNYCKDRRFIFLARVFIVAGSIVTLGPFVFGFCKGVYLAGAIAAVVLAVVSTFNKPAVAIRYVYAEIFVVTFSSLADLLVFCP